MVIEQVMLFVALVGVFGFAIVAVMVAEGERAVKPRAVATNCNERNPNRAGARRRWDWNV